MPVPIRKIKSIREADLNKKTVIHHCDFNIKLKKDPNGELVPVSDVRLKAYFPSIFFLLNRRCKVVFISYLERPGGKVVDALRMEPVAARLSRIINRRVYYLKKAIGADVRKFISHMNPGEMVMLENTRFYPGEELDDDRFAKSLAENGDLMILDAFGHVHRIHASVTGIPRHIPTYAGLYLESEINTFNNLLKKPKKPLVLIVGGTKTHDKIKAIRNLINLSDYVLVGGAVANNFYKAQGINVQNSFLEEPFVDKAKKEKISPLDEAKKLLVQYPNKIVVPHDVVISDSLVSPKKKSSINFKNRSSITKNWSILDIGPSTVKKFESIIKKAKTVFWDGPMGLYENPLFRTGTLKVAEAVSDNQGTTILAGGDTAALAEDFGLIFKYSHVSIAGGAALEYLAGKELPGLASLLK